MPADKLSEAKAELLESIAVSARAAREAPSNAREYYARVALMLAQAHAALEHGAVGMIDLDRKG